MAKVAVKKKKKITVFDVVNTIVFILISLLILVPIWKVLVDSLDLRTSYGMSLWPKEFGFDGYITVFSNPTLYKPFLISVVTTVCGTALGLLLCTLGGYVLIQWKMPGRNILAGLLLFTMIFEGGMIPTYLVVNKMHLTNTLFSVIFIPAINIYNLVLMRNFFEGIPNALFEAAEIDGASIWQKIRYIDLPSLVPTAVMVFILDCGKLLNSNTDKALVMQTPGNIPTSDIIGVYVYNVGLGSGQFSYTAAIGLFVNIINFILIISVNKIAKKTTDTGLF